MAANLDADRQKITALLTQKAGLQKKTAAQAAASKARSTKLAAEAKDLQELIDRLARERAAAQAAADQAAAVAAAAPPPAGRPTGRAGKHCRGPAGRARHRGPRARSSRHDAARGPGARPRCAGRPPLWPWAAPAPKSIRAFPGVPGSLVRPVAGPLIAHFGEVDATGSRAKGILIQTRAGATVLAPFDGQVIFRGPFRGYGEILIIEHGGGYHSVLAGLGRSDAAVGQWVLAGEPVGAMGSPQDGKAQLYVELRRDGQPIDPAPWLGKSDTNVE